jgi:threonine synthase
MTMEISNNDIARILGNIEANLQTQMQSSVRQEAALASLDTKISLRLDGHDERLRQLEVINPAQIAESVKDHEERLQSLERGAAKAGVISGVGSAVGMAVIIEIAKRKLGL